MYYNRAMKKKIVQIRISETEKKGFEQATKLAGLTMSGWIRERLRIAAIRELNDAGIRAPFINADN